MEAHLSPFAFRSIAPERAETSLHAGYKGVQLQYVSAELNKLLI